MVFFLGHSPRLDSVNRMKCLLVIIFSFRTQIKSERRTLGDHFPVVDAARVNLTRFIKYKMKGH